MNLILGIIVWFLQLIKLVTGFIFANTIGLFRAVGNHAGSPFGGGLTFVRAYAYLINLEDYGNSVEQSNLFAIEVFASGSNPDTDRKMILGASNYIKENTGGKQLPVIEEARAKGFLG